MVQKLLRSRRVHLVANVGFATVLLAVAVVSARHFVKSGWPLKHADPVLVAAALLLFLIAYAFKAWAGSGSSPSTSARAPMRSRAPAAQPASAGSPSRAASTTRFASRSSGDFPAPARASAPSA